jgi:hypothetical protein
MKDGVEVGFDRLSPYLASMAAKKMPGNPLAIARGSVPCLLNRERQ